MKKILALALAVVMLFAFVMAVSAEETETKSGLVFQKIDARNMFDKQVIEIKEIAKTAPVIDGVIGTDEYTTEYEIFDSSDITNTAQGYFSYKDGFVYVGAVKDAGKFTSTYEIQIDVGNASYNHPYVTVDRINNRINPNGTVKQNQFGCLFRDDKGWNNLGSHPRLSNAATKYTYFIKESANVLVDGKIIVEAKLDAVEIMKFFAEHEAYKKWNTEVSSWAITYMIWFDNIGYYCAAPAVCVYYDIYWPNQSINWNWAMYTIVLPEQPAIHLFDPSKPVETEPPTEAPTEPPTEAPTEAPTTEAVTTAPVSETVTAIEENTTTAVGNQSQPKGGCSGSVISSLVVIAMIGCGAAVVCKKKK